MFARLMTVAYNAYREAVRARVLLGLAGVAVAVAFYSLVVGAFTLRDAPRVVADLGATAVSVFSIAVAIYIGGTSLHRELEMKTILPLLARPIRRGEYLVGKYVGTMLVVAVFVMAEGGLVLMMSAAMGGQPVELVLSVGAVLVVAMIAAALRSTAMGTIAPIPWAAAMMVAGFLLCDVAPGERSLIMASCALTVLEVMIVAAFATLFSSFSTPFLSALLTLGVFLVGRNADSLARLPVNVFGETGRAAGKQFAKVVPNLHTYVPSRPLLTGEALDANLAGYLGMAAVQTLGWTLVLLAAAAFVFQRRDFI